jgi:hypothetical protein
MQIDTELKVGVAEAKRVANFATLEECQRWLSDAQADKGFWLNRFEFINSYGSAWYLDIEAGLLNNYHANAMATNERLGKLDGLVERLSSVSASLVAPDGRTNLPCRPRRENLGPYWSDAGLIVNTRGTEGQVHADYEGLAPYPAKLFSADTRAYSAVLSLAKPKIGGNLKIWLRRHLGNEEPDLEDFTSQVVDYSPGALAVFDSFCYHQILGSQLTAETPIRAIAGMHFLYIDEPFSHWEYWF